MAAEPESFLRSHLDTVHSFQLRPNEIFDNVGGVLFPLYFGEDSKFFYDWHEANGGTTDVEVGCWSTGLNGFLEREQRFKVSLAGRISNCTEEHRLAEVSPDMVVFEARNRIIDVPFADSFRVEFRLVFSRSSKKEDVVIDVDCSCGVHFDWSIPMAGSIASACLSSFDSSFNNLQHLMSRILKGEGCDESAGERMHRDSDDKEILSLSAAAQCRQQFDYATRNDDALVWLECVSSGDLMTARNGIVTLESCVDSKDSAFMWRLIPDKDTTTGTLVYGLRCESSLEFIGKSFLGSIIAGSTKLRSWERFELDFNSTIGAFALINLDWNLGHGAYIVRNAMHHEQLVCSANRTTAADAVHFCVRLVKSDGIQRAGNTGCALKETKEQTTTDTPNGKPAHSLHLEAQKQRAYTKRAVSVNQRSLGLQIAVVFSLLSFFFGYLLLPAP
mmetsp:Transcript_33771/g.69037  ORF Transcript_33771/g.69037 Transcript_33771/m.69037 type:complete len:445 (+) Transcript_33771:199-1533(+)